MSSQPRRPIEEMPQLDPNYPMRPDNPCLNMTDDEFKAYIREKRAEFEAKYKGKTNEQIKEIQDKERGWL